MMTPPKMKRNLRVTLSLAAVTLLCGAPSYSASISGSGNGGVLRPGAKTKSIAQAGNYSSGLTLNVSQHQGAEALDVNGTAPPNVPVTITLLATVSSDIPTIVVSRQDVITDVNGRFGAVVPIASAYERGTILKIVATSLPGAIPASQQFITNAPNAGVSVPLEQTPHRAR
jgi:hypothetical protein